MRQVGDRLIPVGVTSGRVHTLVPQEVAAAVNVENGSRRGRRRGPGGDALEQFMGMTGPDLEEVSFWVPDYGFLLTRTFYQVDAYGSHAFVYAGP